MIWLVCQPECSYVKDRNEVIERWYPPAGHWFKFQVVEFENGATMDEMRSKVLVADQPVELTPQEVAHYRKKYGGQEPDPA